MNGLPLCGSVKTLSVPSVFVSVSSEISKAVGEYERFVATLINGYVGPVTSRYLRGLQDRLADIGFDGELHIMQCHGGMVPLGIGAVCSAGVVPCLQVIEQLAASRSPHGLGRPCRLDGGVPLQWPGGAGASFSPLVSTHQIPWAA